MSRSRASQSAWARSFAWSRGGEVGESLGHSIEAEGVKLIEGWMFEHVGLLVGSSAARGCWDEGSGQCPRALWRGPPIEPGIEDGFDRAIGPGADLDGALGSGLDARGAERADETARCRDRRGSPARDVACLPGFARAPQSPGRSCGRLRGCARSSSRRSACDWTACARERSCASGSRLRADERRCARPYGKSRPGRRVSARLDLGAGEAVGDRIIVGVDVDVIVDADLAHAPLAVFVRLAGQRP